MGDPGEADGDGTVGAKRSLRRRLLSRGGALLVTGVSLYIVGPSLLDAFSSWEQLIELEPGWLVLAVLTQVLAFACVWGLQRLALRTDRWAPVVSSQLVGNAAGKVIPGGAATGAAVQVRMLRRSGIEIATATSGLTAVGLLQLATTLALPLVALPGALAASSTPRALTNAAWIGAALFVVVFLVVLEVLADDHLLKWAGAVADRAPRLIGRRPPPEKLPTATKLLAERDELRAWLGARWRTAVLLTVGRTAFDYATLMVAITAFGSDARASSVLLAYASAAILGMIPLTPGGLGFVEAGLTGTLTLAGVSAADAVGVALLYRLVSFWLPIPVGLLVAAVLNRSGRAPDPAVE